MRRNRVWLIGGLAIAVGITGLVAWSNQAAQRRQASIELVSALNDWKPSRALEAIEKGADANASVTRVQDTSWQSRIPFTLAWRRNRDAPRFPKPIQLLLDWRELDDDFPPENVKLLDSLLSHGSNPNVTNDLGVSPLISAICSGKKQSVRILLDHAANPNFGAYNGSSPLITAVQFEDVESVKELLKHGAKRDGKTKDGKTAFQLAEHKGYRDIAEILRSK